MRARTVAAFLALLTCVACSHWNHFPATYEGVIPTPGGRLPEIAPPTQPAAIVDGTEPRADAHRLHEQGYVCLGLAHFDDLDERMSLDDEKKDALQFAQSIGAETVFIYRRSARAWTEERSRADAPCRLGPPARCRSTTRRSRSTSGSTTGTASPTWPAP